MKRNLYYILLALSAEDRHGSAIAREVAELTDGEVTLWPATLYGSLAELEAQRLIESLDGTRARPEGESERKRYFRLTRSGRRALEAETRRLAALVALAEQRLHAEERP
jgi:DNA-binding PadR family transcriptional regulator